MSDRAFDWVPACIRAYGDVHSRARGTLDLTFAQVAGRTRITHAAYAAPLAVQRVQYGEPCLPGMAVVPVLTVGGGILGGDRLTQTIRAEAGVRVHLTTVTATKLYRMPTGYAAQETTVIAADGAHVEMLPAPLIAQRNTRYAARLHLIAAPTATVLCGDILIPGRLAMGERGVYDAVSLVTQASQARESEPGWRDALMIEPASLPGGAPMVIGTLFGLASVAPAAVLADAMHAACLADGAFAAVHWGVSELPDGSGVMVRIAGTESRAVQDAHCVAAHHLRRLLRGIGTPAPTS